MESQNGKIKMTFADIWGNIYFPLNFDFLKRMRILELFQLSLEGAEKCNGIKKEEESNSDT